jgi:hypothetical protein
MIIATLLSRPINHRFPGAANYSRRQFPALARVERSEGFSFFFSQASLSRLIATLEMSLNRIRQIAPLQEVRQHDKGFLTKYLADTPTDFNDLST